MEDAEAGEAEHGYAGDGHGGGPEDRGESGVEGEADGVVGARLGFEEFAVAADDEEGIVYARAVEENEREDLFGHSGMNSEGSKQREELEDDDSGEA